MLSSIPIVGRLFSRERAPPSACGLAAVPVHNTESDPEKRTRTLKYLLKGNHFNGCLIRGTEHELGEAAAAAADRHCYNDVAYLLYAVYMMGGSTELLNAVYEKVTAAEGSDWPPSPAELAHIDWRDFLGQPRYQHAYVDFFEDVLAEHRVAYNWHTVVQQYLLGEGYDESSHMEYDEGNDDTSDAKCGIFLRHCLLGAGGAPLLHLACAFELDSRQLAMEGLALAASTYREDVAQFLAELTATDNAAVEEATATKVASSLRAVLEAARNDSRLGVYKNAVQPSSNGTQQPGFGIMAGNFSTSEARAAFVEHWRTWDLAGTDDLTPKLREAQRVFADLLVASGGPADSNKKKHDHALASVLAVSHGVRVLLPFIPAKYHLCVMQQWWLLALSVYLDVGMPVPAEGSADTSSKDWKYVNDKMLQEWRFDRAYMMALCSLQAAQQTWPDEADHYLTAAVRFVDEFDGWSS